MAKPEWGVKRTCPSCGARFYDLKRSPILCPKCDTKIDPGAVQRPHRAASAAAAAALKKKASAPSNPALDVKLARMGDVMAPDEGDDIGILVDGDDDDDVVVVDVDEVDADDEGLIEDASDLGGDEEDMAEVMEHIEDDVTDS